MLPASASIRHSWLSALTAMRLRLTFWIPSLPSTFGPMLGSGGHEPKPSKILLFSLGPAAHVEALLLFIFSLVDYPFPFFILFGHSLTADVSWSGGRGASLFPPMSRVRYLRVAESMF